MTYGLEHPASEYRPLRSVITEPKATADGNIMLRIGREISDESWERTEHVVLTPFEAQNLAHHLLASLES